MARVARKDGRKADQLRPVKITTGYVPTADGSCLIEMGHTRIICTAMYEPGVPQWLIGSGNGWVTAEYGMLPGCTPKRKKRPIGKPDSRAIEIQRLIGRVLRSVIVMDRLGENTIYLDCDVLTADGGTRTASITGAYAALALAVANVQRRGLLGKKILSGSVAAVSVGLAGGKALLDMDYSEDVSAEVDMNVAMLDSGHFVEVQGTSEHAPFDRQQLDAMLVLAQNGIRQLLQAQKKALHGVK
jgi:ribonuclease PH